MSVITSIVPGETGWGNAADTINHAWGAAAHKLGFVANDSSAGAKGANKIAWEALVNAGGAVQFGPHDYYLFDVPSAALFSSPGVIMNGFRGKTRIIVDHANLPASALFNIVSGSLFCSGIEFVCTGLPSLASNSGKALVYAWDMSADIGDICFEGCTFTGFETGLRSATGLSTNRKKVRRIRLIDNDVNCRGGLCRLMATPMDDVSIVDNRIDCLGAGILAGFGGIILSYIENNGDGLTPERTAKVHVERNRVRRVRPLTDPGSPGNYGIQIQAQTATVQENIVEKVYLFGGTARNEVVFTGDGATRAFEATLTYLPLLDSLTLTGTGVSVSDDDHGWFGPGKQYLRGTGLASEQGTMSTVGDIDGATGVITNVANTGLVFPGMGISGVGIPSNSYVTAVDKVAGTITIACSRPAAGATLTTVAGTAVVLTFSDYASWVDYNTRKLRVFFAVAPANGVQFTAAYKESPAAVDNIESIYVKCSNVDISGNKVFDCQNKQAAIGLKGGGSLGFTRDNADLTPQFRGYWYTTPGGYSGGAGSAYAAVVERNVVKNQVRTGVFSTARAVWVQHDFAIIKDNTFDGLTDRIVRTNTSSMRGKRLVVKDNNILNYYGQNPVVIQDDWEDVEIGVTIAGWQYDGAAILLDVTNAVATPHATTADQHRPTRNLKKCVIGPVKILEDAHANLTLDILKVTTPDTVSSEIIVEKVDCSRPWRFEDKRGNGAGGKRIFRQYSTANNTGKQVVFAGAVATAVIVDDGGHA